MSSPLAPSPNPHDMYRDMSNDGCVKQFSKLFILKKPQTHLPSKTNESHVENGFNVNTNTVDSGHRAFVLTLIGLLILAGWYLV